jgi:hypothetical protein
MPDLSDLPEGKALFTNGPQNARSWILDFELFKLKLVYEKGGAGKLNLLLLEDIQQIP